MTKPITAGMVRELREMTGAGMMDCKKALTETKGETEAAVDWLRKKGLSSAGKKSARVAADGLVGVLTNEKVGAIVEVNSETDFVARNDQFQGFVKEVTQLVLDNDVDVEKLKTLKVPSSGRTVQEEITHLIAVIGENMALRRVGRLEVKEGVVSSYMHNAIAPNLGKIGVLVALEAPAKTEELQAFAKSLSMHVAAAKPEYLSIEDISADALKRERTVLMEQAKASGQPDNIIEKIIEGRIRKFYEEVVLHEQVYVIDGKTKVNKLVKAHKGEPNIAGFFRYGLGEGIEKEATDFAEEVAAQANK